MSEIGMKGMSWKNILKGTAVWAAAGLSLTIAAAVVIGRTDIQEKTVVYISSAVTFISAAAAGVVLRRKKENILCCLLLSVFLIILTLSLGFLLDSSRLESGGILSVVSFSLSGALCGHVLEIPKKKRSKIKL